MCTRLKYLYFMPLLLPAGSIFSQQKATQDTIIFCVTASIVDSLPEFPGGSSQLMKFVMSHVELPASSKENPPAASLKIGFTVYTDGRVGDIHVLKSTGNTAVDMAFMQALEASPHWKPGFKNGKAVNTCFMLPIACILYK